MITTALPPLLSRTPAGFRVPVATFLLYQSQFFCKYLVDNQYKTEMFMSEKPAFGGGPVWAEAAKKTLINLLVLCFHINVKGLHYFN